YDYWQYTAQGISYYLTFQAKEDDTGYQAIQILAGEELNTDYYPYEGGFQGTFDGSKIAYAALFEHGKNGDANKNYFDYHFPAGKNTVPFQDSSNRKSTLTVSKYGNDQSGEFLVFPVNTENITAGFGASGEKSDTWYT